jgi:8-oxo-dGTP pyrophosphatase MutT (NUDIX family)
MMPAPISVVRVILQDSNGGILFLKRKNAKNANNMWCLPGGRKGDESFEEAVRRETKEETNLDLSKIQYLFDYPIPAIIGQTDKSSICSVFRASYSGDIRLNEEHSEYSWIYPRNIVKYPIAFHHNRIIERFLITLFK